MPYLTCQIIAESDSPKSSAEQSNEELHVSLKIAMDMHVCRVVKQYQVAQPAVQICQYAFEAHDGLSAH